MEPAEQKGGEAGEGRAVPARHPSHLCVALTSIPWWALKTSSRARGLFLMDFKVKRVQKMRTWANKRELDFSCFCDSNYEVSDLLKSFLQDSQK